MERNKEIAARLREVLLDGKWIANTNFKEQLERISWEQATEKIEDLNTIAQLTFHVSYYVKGILDFLNGEGLNIKDEFSFTMDPIEEEGKWIELKNDFISYSEQLANKIEVLPDAILDSVFVDPKYGTYLRNLEALIEHSYYHLGQVSLLIKLLSKK